MFWALDAAILALALAGHFALGLAYANHVHTLRLPRGVIALGTRTGQLAFVVIWATIAWWFYRHGFGIVARPAGDSIPAVFVLFLLVTVPIGAGPVPLWFYRRLWPRPCPQLRASISTPYDLVERLGRHPIAPGVRARVAQLPGNQCFEIDLAEKELVLPRLPESLDGLSIAHLSDLHLHDGLFEQAFYDEAIELTNELRADLVMITGDLIDHRACIDWIPPLLGRLESRWGGFAIFGNHDWLVGECPALEAAVAAAGLTYLGGRWHRLLVDGEEIWLAGNELPWLPPAAPLDARPRRGADGRPLSIALVHTPDQYAWARRGDFDLMLSGHTHGGQVALPRLGPLFAASRTGVRYASGVFYEAPTVLHVSRGLAGCEPLRFNCRPEVTKLTLRCPAGRRSSADDAVQELIAVG
ncbi:MAG: metallophosphoesterase [Pirellulales bacterium]|nr:metallophosphoesterase [Pirellulales bacterium]